MNNVEKKKSARTKIRRQQQKRALAKRKRLLTEIAISSGVTLFICAMISVICFRIVEIKGYAMSPTLNNQEWVLVNKFEKIKRFNLVYLTKPSSTDKLVRRVVGLPGETVVYESGILYIDGEETPERFLPSISLPGTDVSITEDFSIATLLVNDQTTIPDGYYLVLGDNRPYASDSRYFGLVPETDILGKVTTRLFPLSNMRKLV